MAQSSLKLTTIAACRVARIDRQRFNEHVAAGDYPCAPKTVPGRSRLFDESDLIALFVFAREVERGVKPGAAGSLACQVRETLTDRPDAETSVLADIVSGPHSQLVQPDTKLAARWAIGVPLKLTTYNVAGVRALVREGIEEQATIIGPEDDD